MVLHARDGGNISLRNTQKRNLDENTLKLNRNKSAHNTWNEWPLHVEIQNSGDRFQTAMTRASVVFVDRTLDVASVAGNHGDTLADRIINLLPRLPHHHNDVLVNMSDLCNFHPWVALSSPIPFANDESQSDGGLLKPWAVRATFGKFLKIRHSFLSTRKHRKW